MHFDASLLHRCASGERGAAFRLGFYEDSWSNPVSYRDNPLRLGMALAYWHTGCATQLRYIQTACGGALSAGGERNQDQDSGDIAKRIAQIADSRRPVRSSWSRPREVRSAHRKRHSTKTHSVKMDRGYSSRLIRELDRTWTGPGDRWGSGEQVLQACTEEHWVRGTAGRASSPRPQLPPMPAVALIHI
jgi:hypothetical protein